MDSSAKSLSFWLLNTSFILFHWREGRGIYEYVNWRLTKKKKKKAKSRLPRQERKSAFFFFLFFILIKMSSQIEDAFLFSSFLLHSLNEIKFRGWFSLIFIIVLQLVVTPSIPPFFGNIILCWRWCKNSTCGF